MTSEIYAETVTLEDLRRTLRQHGTELDTIARMEDGRWFASTIGRHHVDAIAHSDHDAIRRVVEGVRHAAGVTVQIAWTWTGGNRDQRRRPNR